MSNREKIIALLDSVPEYKMGYVLAYVQGITADERQMISFVSGCLKTTRTTQTPKRTKATPWMSASGNGGLLDVSNHHQEESKKVY